MRKSCGEESFSVSNMLPDGFVRLIRDFIIDSEDFMKRYPQTPFSGELLTLFFDALTYVRTSEAFDSRIKASPSGTEAMSYIGFSV